MTAARTKANLARRLDRLRKTPHERQVLLELPREDTLLRLEPLVDRFGDSRVEKLGHALEVEGLEHRVEGEHVATAPLCERWNEQHLPRPQAHGNRDSEGVPGEARIPAHAEPSTGD